MIDATGISDYINKEIVLDEDKRRALKAEDNLMRIEERCL